MNLSAPPWLIDWLKAVSVWDLVIILAALAAVIIFIRKKGWRTVVALARGVIAYAEILSSVQGLPEFIVRTDSRLNEHTHQLKNSHATNLGDDVTQALEAVERTEKSVEGLHERLDNVERNVTALTEADLEIRAELEQTNPSKE